MQVQPYLFFDGRCEEALEFYRKALGAEVTMLMRFKDNPEPQPESTCGPQASPEKVMHAWIYGVRLDKELNRAWIYGVRLDKELNRV